MQVTSNDTKKKKRRKKGSGGARAGSGRKSTGKKSRSYFLSAEIIDAVSKTENPSLYVEEAIKKQLIADGIHQL